jgi:hypothetical protein
MLNGLLFFGALITAAILWIQHEKTVRTRLDRAYGVGRDKGYYEGWLAHANGTPLHTMPPRLQEIEEVTGISQGWGNNFYSYPDTDELVQSGCLGNIAWEEWQARKLKQLNDKYAGRQNSP